MVEFKFRTQGVGHRFHGITIEVTLQKKQCRNYETFEVGEYTVLSIVGHTSGTWGQCQDTISNALKYIVPAKAQNVARRLVELWNEYHLNDMQAGSKEQMDCLKDFIYDRQLDSSYYDQELAFLEAHSLKWVDCPEFFSEDGTYKFGSAWLCKPIPEEIVSEIEQMCGSGVWGRQKHYR